MVDKETRRLMSCSSERGREGALGAAEQIWVVVILHRLVHPLILSQLSIWCDHTQHKHTHTGPDRSIEQYLQLFIYEMSQADLYSNPNLTLYL